MFFDQMKLLGETTGEVKIVADMHQRKSEMAKQADAFIALPGDYNLNSLHILLPSFLHIFINLSNLR